MTTLEKLRALIAAIEDEDPEGFPDEVRGFVSGVQMLQGLGVDLFGMLLPDSDAEADMLVDHCIHLLISIRGEDLPPLSLTGYGEILPPAKPELEP